jgi:hypothetical protein
LPGGEQEFKESFDHLAEGETIPDEDAVPWEKAVKGLYDSINIRKGYDKCELQNRISPISSQNSRLPDKPRK